MARSFNQGYSAGQASRATGVTYRCVDHWDKIGFISPSLVQADGTGSARQYSFADLVALRAAKQLRDAGISLSKLQRVVDYLRKRRGYQNPLADAYLVSTTNGDVLEKTERDLISLIKSPGQRLFLWVLDLGAMVKELQADVVKLEKPKRGPASQVA
jgi:DNA-binding transcriptional MerR regulator